MVSGAIVIVHEKVMCRTANTLIQPLLDYVAHRFNIMPFAYSTAPDSLWARKVWEVLFLPIHKNVNCLMYCPTIDPICACLFTRPVFPEGMYRLRELNVVLRVLIQFLLLWRSSTRHPQLPFTLHVSRITPHKASRYSSHGWLRAGTPGPRPGLCLASRACGHS